ncbi:tapasin-related protein [Aulostomus maculatus]
MMVTEIILLGYFTTCVSASGVADVVLSCYLVNDRVGLGQRSSLRQTPATLILRDVAVASHESLEALPPFVPPSIPDPNSLLFESKVTSPEIPNVDVLLHADCNEQEVMCEISTYSPHGTKEDSQPAYFMVSINVDAVDFSTTLILQTVELEKDHSTLIQRMLDLPLSPSGTLLTEVVFLVFSNSNSVSAPLRGEALLDCGFKHQPIPSLQEVGIEWRLQHRGKGQKVLEMRMRPDDVEGSAVVHHERRDSSIDAAQVVGEGNASMTLSKIKVTDVGTYICTVKLGPFHAQQVIHLQVFQPPSVTMSDEMLWKENSHQTLGCHCNKYYPLDAEMEWSSLSPADTEPTVLANQGSLSSHRQHGDGTYSLSSHLTLPSSIPPGTEIICKVSHPALDAPLSVSLVVKSPESDSYWWVLSFLLITLIFFYQVMR